MIEKTLFFPAKAILFGEYTVVRGGQALAVPLPIFGGKWAWAEPEFQAEKQQRLVEFSRSAEAADLDFQAFQNDLAAGLFFDSNIPTGYGLGSSGAVVAAVFDRFGGQKPTDLSELKTTLGRLESFFHGKSSGLDPLVSFLKKNLLVEQEKIVLLDSDFNQNLGAHKPTIFLLDSKTPRSAKPLIHWFLERTNDSIFSKKIADELMFFNHEAIRAFIENEPEKLFEHYHSISLFQLENMQPMIPDFLRSAWADGLASSFFKLKLCGAGGGGFMLGISTDWPKTEEALRGFELLPIF